MKLEQANQQQPPKINFGWFGLTALRWLSQPAVTSRTSTSDT